MTQPKRSGAYPPSFREACLLAVQHGSLRIPHPKPHLLRRSFYGYFAALRREDAPEFGDSLECAIDADDNGENPALILQLREAKADALAVSAAVAAFKGKT